MVAISLYRGNLHRVSDLPRRWLMPKHQISLKHFGFLTRKRDRALSTLRSTATVAADETPNPNWEQQEEVVGDNGCSKKNHVQIAQTAHQQLQTAVLPKDNNGDSKDAHRQLIREGKDHDGGLDGEDTQLPRETDETVPSPPEKSAVPEKDCGGRDAGADGTSQGFPEGEHLVSAKPNSEINNNVEVLSDREKKKRELEQKLQVLNEKKHNLVQMLKQILNAEDEMKKRNSMQASVVRSPIPSQVEATNDMGTNPRQAVNRMGSEANSSGDLEGESEDTSNHNAHARHFQQMSPSSSSPLRRPTHGSFQHNVVPHTTRPSLGTSGHSQTSNALLGVAASPSHFAPAGHQVHPASLPPLATSGTPFTASSPSPAASGGTSVFRDTRWTGPTWN